MKKITLEEQALLDTIKEFKVKPDELVRIIELLEMHDTFEPRKKVLKQMVEYYPVQRDKLIQCNRKNND